MTNIELKAQIDSQITNETTPLGISPTDVGGNLDAIVDYIDQQTGAGNTVKLLLSQTLTNAPTAVIGMNNFSAAPTYTRVSAGKFSIIMPAGSLTGKTVICQAVSSTDTPLLLSVNQSGGSTIGLWARTESGVFVDELIEISVVIEAF